MKQIILAIDGMTCSGCSNGLEKFLNKQKGINSASVNLIMANASIEYDEKVLNVRQIEDFVKKAGFKSLGEFKEIRTEERQKTEKIKFIVFSVLAIIMLYISMGHMAGLPIPAIINPESNPIYYTLVLLILTIAFLVYGFDILKSGCKNLIHKTPNMDTLVTLGVVASFIYSLYNMYMIFMGNHSYTMNLYFESCAIIIYFMKLGRYVDGVSKDKTKDVIKKLVEITPKNATIKIDGKLQTVTLDEIKKGDIVVVKPGEKIAVDGEISLGRAHLDESFITGESKPILKTVGEKVIAGSLNYDGYLEYKAEKIGKESMASGIVKLVVSASNSKPPIAKVADTVSGYFVPTVIAIAFITFIVYLLLGYQFSVAINAFVTTLVVACPCSLGLATPLAIVVSEGLCASNGILVKKGEILETAKKVDTVVFDKTGTLTYGKFKIAKVFNYSNLSDDEIIKIAGSLELKSSHPISKAFEDYLLEHNINALDVQNFDSITGLGITGLIDGKNIILGNGKILEKFDIANAYNNDKDLLVEDGNSIIYVVINSEISALIGVNDIVRENANNAIDSLNKSNIKTIMLTGDNDSTAQKIADEIGITQVISNVVPSQKADIIKGLKEKGDFVLMCGDGINDSPAIMTADIGVSVNCGTDIAIDSSNVILTKNDLNQILNLIEASKSTLKIIKQNLFWAFFYNILMIPIAVGVFSFAGITINPMIASFAMVISSATVIINTLRLKKIQFDKNKK